MSDIKNKAGSQFYRFTTTRPVAILMVVLGVCVFGYISYKQLPVNLMPDISYPSLTVRTEYEGTAPEEVETTISRPVEQALGVVNHLVSISSISKAGQSDVKLEFTWDTDMNQATADVREKLDQVFLPDEVERPLILRFDPSLDPIMRFGIYGEAPMTYLRILSDEEIKRALEQVDGVAAVKVKGGLEEEIRVDMDEQKLTLIGIDIQQVRNRLAQENVNLAGGNLKEGQTEYLVRTMNEFRSVPEVGEVVIGNWNGKEIKIRDVAQVRRSFKDREIITRIQNIESVEIEIYKEADANIVDVAQRVRERVFGTEEQQAFVANMKKPKEPTDGKSTNDKGTNGKDKKQGGQNGGPNNFEEMRRKQMTNFISYTLPENIHMDLLSDQSVFIKNSVDDVKNTAVAGGILAIIVLFVFLRNLTATLIVGISIPISIVATFAPMRIFDVSLNIMSLGGLALGIGMLVDNSIVVLESIARCREEGDNLIDATVRGVSEVGSAVVASTLTTVAVFFPIVFVDGVAGQIFGNMALTVVFSLLASLAVALFLIPMLFSRESSRFVAGLRTGNFSKRHLLRFSTEVQLDELYAPGNNKSFLEKFADAMVIIAMTVVLFMMKVLQLLSALIVGILKQVVILLATILLPIFGLLRLVKIIKFHPSEKLAQFATSDTISGIQYLREIWEGYLVSNSFVTLKQDCARFNAKFKEAGAWRSIFQVILSPLTFIFYFIKFVLLILLEILFRLLHVIVMFVAVFLKSIVILARAIFTVPVSLGLALFNFGYGKIESFYPRFLQRTLDNRAVALTSISLLFLFTILVVAPRIGSELIPEVHQGEFNVEITLPVGTPVEQTDAQIAEIQGFIQQQEGVAKVASVSGTDKTVNSTSEEGEHTSKVTVTLVSESDLASEEERIISAVREKMSRYPGIKWKISRPVLFSFKTPIEVEIRGYNLTKLQQYASQLEERMAKIPGVQDVKSNIQRGNPEVQIVYNRPVLAKYGLNIRNVADIIRNKVRGDVATEFKELDRKIDVRVRLREPDRESMSDLSRLVVNPGDEKPIPLAAVANIKVVEGPSEIRRVDQQRTAVITANLNKRSLSEVSADIYGELRAMDLSEEFTFGLAGQNEEMETSLNSLKLALALAIFLVYIVMASQFESMVHPFIIIFTIPLALIGVILWLFVFQIPLSIVVFLGMIMLAGIVVNNAIVLVDYINKLRERGVEKMAAIVQAGQVRLRPIMMTTLTTVLGLLPMALGWGEGAEIRTPMAITVIIGLLSSTILTLIIIPTVYSLVDFKRDEDMANA